MKKEIKYEIDEDTPSSKCKGCGMQIFWIQTEGSAYPNMPCNPDGTPHWGTCPKAKRFKKKKEEV